MKYLFHLLQSFLLIQFILATTTSQGQVKLVHQVTKENRYCNDNCTFLNHPDLNNNPRAIILVTPKLRGELNINPHPIGVYYFMNKWSIFNLDQTVMPVGAVFDVTYTTKADESIFQYSTTLGNIQKDGTAIIDHPSLNNHPEARMEFLLSWNPSERQWANRYEVNMRYNRELGKWTVSNLNKKAMYHGVFYNIIVSSRGNPDADSLRGKQDISKRDPKDFIKPAEIIIPDYNKTGSRKDSITRLIPGNPVGLIGVRKDSVKKTIPAAYNFNNVHVCIEEITNKNLPPRPPAIPLVTIPKINPDGTLQPVTTITQSLSALTDLMWSNGETISVGFLQGETKSVINNVKKYAKEWETYANIKFVFPNDASQAMVKVGFKKDGTSWSWMGRDVLVNQSEGRTMNFGWLDDQTRESDFRRVVLHEFGHALGFIHEHQSPAGGIPWDSAKVYSYYGGSPNKWSKAKVDENIFQKYSATSTNSSAYDRLSIMHYAFPAELTTDSSSVPLNTELSATDKTFAGIIYPFPPAPVTATGVLQTGDDCDEIEFKVEYNVVNSNEIAFFLEPGKDKNNTVLTWWKMIAIPIIGGQVGIEIQDGHSATKKVAAGIIDKSRGIGFGKAKVLGVHTGLPFVWHIWPAIVGGCRVTLVWRRDSCKQPG